MKLDEYETVFYTEPTGILAAENAVLAELILTCEPRGKRLLDLGCGCGYWTERLRDQAAIVTAVDRSSIALDSCRAKISDVRFVQLTGANLPFARGAFELVLLSWVLQEVCSDDELATLRDEIVRVLVSGGRLVVAENLYPDARRRIRCSRSGDIFADATGRTALRFFADNTTTQLFAGLTLGERRLVGHSFFEVYEKRA